MKENKTLKYIGIFLGVFILIIGIGYAIANNYFNKLQINRQDIDDTLIVNPDEKATEKSTEADEKKPDKEEKLGDVKIFIMGTDHSGYLTDTMMIVNADFDSDTVSLFSLPRDYRITLTPKIQEMIGHYSKNIKLTELHSFAKMAEHESPPSITASVAEDLVGMEFDYIVLVKLKAFREAVDALGGVEVYVPRDFNYDDPYQDLSIHLKKGKHLLDGKTAEGLVRFRRSNDGDDYSDFDRIEMQQYFMKEFAKKMISMEGALNITELFHVIEKNVKTDAKLNDAIDLFSKATNLSMERIYSHTLPGKHDFVDGVYFYSPPPIKELHKLVEEEIKTDREKTVSSKDYPIHVLNGSFKRKAADKYAKILKKDGYEIEKIGDYDSDDEFTNKTRIYVPKDNLGKDLQKYFPLSEIILDEENDYITIIIGKLIEE